MILTVTPNPSLDRTYEVPALDRGDVSGPPATASTPAARASTSRAPSPPRGSARSPCCRSAARRARCSPTCWTSRASRSPPVPGRRARPASTSRSPSRTASSRRSTRRARSCTAAEAGARCWRPCASSPRDADWIACCGSLPRGLAPSWYAELVARAHRAGARIALDTSGPALLAALRERPDVVKPNAEELAEAVGRPLATVGDAVKAAEELRELGARAVLASLGADGQLLVDGDGRLLRHRARGRRPQQRRRGRLLARRIPRRRRRADPRPSPRPSPTARPPSSCPAA